jgi:hypothetical protein
LGMIVQRKNPGRIKGRITETIFVLAPVVVVITHLSITIMSRYQFGKVIAKTRGQMK